MKTKHGILFGFAILFAAAIFTLSSCGDGAGGGYKLVVQNSSGETTSVQKGGSVSLYLENNGEQVQEWDASFDSSTTPSSTNTMLTKTQASNPPYKTSYSLSVGNDETAATLKIVTSVGEAVTLTVVN
jgi:hypothetical protein